MCEPEGTRESQRMGQREPETEPQGLKVSLRVALAPNLGCQSQERQSELENIDFPYVFLPFLSEIQFYDVFLRVSVTKYRKLCAYLSGRGGEHRRDTLH